MKSPFSLSGKYNTLAAIIGGVAVVSLLVVLLLIRPAWGKLKQLGQEIPIEQQKEQTAQAELDRLQKAKSYFKDHGNDIDKVNVAVPIEPQVPQILVLLEELSKKNGIRLTSFAPQQVGAAAGAGGAAAAPGTTPDPGASTTADSVEVSANFEGSYSSMVNFFFNVEKSLRLIDVKTISVTSGNTSGSSSSDVIKGTISFRAYYKVVEGGPKPAAAPTTGAAR